MPVALRDETTKDTDGRRAEILTRSYKGGTMTNKSQPLYFLTAVVALFTGLQFGVSNAARPGGGGNTGDCFSLSPSNSFTDRDLSSEIGFYISTADATIRNGVLVRTSTTTHPAYSNGSYWISNLSYSSGSTLWNISNFEAFRRDFTNYYPTYRAWLTFNPGGAVRTGYLAAYTSNGRLMKQLTFTAGVPTTLDTGFLSGKIGYVLATFDSPGGQLGQTGACVRWR